MEIKITGTPNEIEKLFNAIGGSKEQNSIEAIYDVAISKHLQEAISRLDSSCFVASSGNHKSRLDKD